jgi:hypothetical protein
LLTGFSISGSKTSSTPEEVTYIPFIPFIYNREAARFLIDVVGDTILIFGYNVPFLKISKRFLPYIHYLMQ